MSLSHNPQHDIYHQLWINQFFPNADNLDDPIATPEAKQHLVPAFLRSRGLVKQHLESFNHFLKYGIKRIVSANSRITCNADTRWFLEYPPYFCLIQFRFKDVYIGQVSESRSYNNHPITPHECRLREMTYSAPIYVNIAYTRGLDTIEARKILIGRMPIMLKSNHCVLQNKSSHELAQLGECPMDPGGYFIVKGQEKTILMQEQVPYNRIMVVKDSRGSITASITSSTEESKTRIDLFFQDNILVVRHSTLSEPIPFIVLMKALGIESDQYILELVGTDKPKFLDALAFSFHKSAKYPVQSHDDALYFLSQKIRGTTRVSWRRFVAVSEASAAVNNSKSHIHSTLTTMVNPSSCTPEVRHGAYIETPSLPVENKKIQAIDDARELLSSMILDHIPGIDSYSKAVLLATMARNLIIAIDDPSQLTNRDHYSFKRIEVAGSLMALLFEDLFKQMCTELQRIAENTLVRQSAVVFDISRIIRPDHLTPGLVGSLSSGNWRIRRFRMNRAGVTHILSRLSYISSLGMMTRLSAQFEKSRKVSGPRALQPSQWGVLCPSDTPEGEACGLIKNLALLSHISQESDPQSTARACFALGVIDTAVLSPTELYAPGNYRVFLNGQILGVTSQPLSFATKFRQLRRRGIIHHYTACTVYDNKRFIEISCDAGRLCRPLLVVRNGQLIMQDRDLLLLTRKLLTFDDLVVKGAIEYIDVAEENNCLIAIYPSEINHNTTHLEIDPMTLLGIVAGLIPFPHHNQSPRNTYQCAMGKQAIGCISTNYLNRYDTIIYSLVYTQRPLVSTRSLTLSQFEYLPGGHNATVAIMSYSGYDIEDALVINKASVDRGYGRCVVYRKYVAPLESYRNRLRDKVAPPKSLNSFKISKFKAVDSYGMPRSGHVVNPSDILINKYSPVDTQSRISPKSTSTIVKGRIDQSIVLNKDDEPLYKASSLAFKGPAAAHIDGVLFMQTSDEKSIFKIKTRHTRRPEVGDKFSSRHGQKGVLGIFVPQSNMPFSQNGTVPDMIMNPHGFPSRMTVGKMYELLASKTGVLSGIAGNGTCFSGEPIQGLSHALIAAGWNYYGKDLLYSGTTGKPLKAYVFFGPVYYQKLKHMVLDKMHARARGPRTMVTRQPTEGRSRDGGFRLGEMERDCLIGHGSSLLLIERLMISSDKFTAFICEKCGLFGYNGWCQHCRRGDTISSVTIPYACKLLFQELMSMGILPKISLT